MRCEYCNHENQDNAQVCENCGKSITSDKKPWHSLHNLLWGNKINQDILDTLNELNHRNEHLMGHARKLKKLEE